MNATAPQSIEPQHYVIGHDDGRLDLIDAVTQQTRSPYAFLQIIADLACRMGSAFAGACRLSSNPAYFEFDRRPRTAADLGAGLTWESDSFWAASYPRG